MRSHPTPTSNRQLSLSHRNLKSLESSPYRSSSRCLIVCVVLADDMMMNLAMLCEHEFNKTHRLPPWTLLFRGIPLDSSHGILCVVFLPTNHRVSRDILSHQPRGVFISILLCWTASSSFCGSFCIISSTWCPDTTAGEKSNRNRDKHGWAMCYISLEDTFGVIVGRLFERKIMMPIKERTCPPGSVKWGRLRQKNKKLQHHGVYARVG